jgi:hypothetical protein
MEMLHYRSRLALVLFFAVAMAMVEAAVVAYLRSLYYPEGFTIMLKALSHQHMMIEVGREIATLVMLATVAGLAGRERWERFGWFITLFGFWDFFYYVWLKITIDWPLSLTDWDILFLIPAPWVGPVVAPMLVSVLMVIAGISITRLYRRRVRFRPTATTWWVSIAATAMTLYTFLRDSGRVTRGQQPEPYSYGLLILGLALYLFAFWWSYRQADE